MIDVQGIIFGSLKFLLIFQYNCHHSYNTPTRPAKHYTHTHNNKYDYSVRERKSKREQNSRKETTQKIKKNPI